MPRWDNTNSQVFSPGALKSKPLDREEMLIEVPYDSLLLRIEKKKLISKKIKYKNLCILKLFNFYIIKANKLNELERIYKNNLLALS